MITFSIRSGSSGNCYFYESHGIKLLFDAGINLRTLKETLLKNNISLSGFKGLFISHDHSDHSGCAGIFHRGIGVPIFITPKTYHALDLRGVRDVLHFQTGDTIQLGHVKVKSIATPHDASDACMFLIDDGVYRVGIFTDLGHPFNELKNHLSELDVLFMESNYDEKMLKENPHYPGFLKRRIKGRRGHLSNIESARLIKNYSNERLKYLFLSHLSDKNNTPELALKTHLDIYEGKHSFRLLIAPRDCPSLVVHL